MYRTRPELKETAKAAFKSHYWPCVAVIALYAVILGSLSGATWGAASLIIHPVLTVGLSAFFLKTVRSENPSIEEFFTIPFSQFTRAFLSVFWANLFTLLWSMLFVIPGIVKAIAYSLTPFLIYDYPNLGWRESVKISMRITEGHKMDIFVLVLSFIGWHLLSALTFGILAIFYVSPYSTASFALMYEDLKNQALANGIVSINELDPQEGSYTVY